MQFCNLGILGLDACVLEALSDGFWCKPYLECSTKIIQNCCLDILFPLGNLFMYSRSFWYFQAVGTSPIPHSLTWIPRNSNFYSTSQSLYSSRNLLIHTALSTITWLCWDLHCFLSNPWLALNKEFRLCSSYTFFTYVKPVFSSWSPFNRSDNMMNRKPLQVHNMRMVASLSSCSIWRKCNSLSSDSQVKF